MDGGGDVRDCERAKARDKNEIVNAKLKHLVTWFRFLSLEWEALYPRVDFLSLS